MHDISKDYIIKGFFGAIPCACFVGVIGIPISVGFGCLMAFLKENEISQQEKKYYNNKRKEK